MKSSDYAKQGRLRVGPVDLIGKMKGCGKDNCGDCPHGPFWYAYVPALVGLDGCRFEVYLGREWTDGDLRAKVAPKIQPGARREFLQVIDVVVRNERIAWLEREAATVAQSIKDVAARAQKDIAKLRRDEAGIKKELHDLRSK